MEPSSSAWVNKDCPALPHPYLESVRSLTEPDICFRILDIQRNPEATLPPHLAEILAKDVLVRESERQADPQTWTGLPESPPPEVPSGI